MVPLVSPVLKIQNVPVSTSFIWRRCLGSQQTVEGQQQCNHNRYPAELKQPRHGRMVGSMGAQEIFREWLASVSTSNR